VDVNPLLPSAYDITWSIVGGVVALAAFAVLLAAIWSIASSRRLTGAGRVLWVVAVLAFPLVGSIVWFVGSRHASLDRGLV
jgi:hypothetical protein